ncbi:MAG: hydroxysqualene dehydroxylase HpnE [Pseudomonadota bacterium]
MKVAVIGAGWAGCTAAVEATRRGYQVTVFEAARTTGGRARRVEVMLADQAQTLDNGQHILIGAYSESLKLMTDVGVDISASLLRLPLTMQFPDGSGLRLPRLPAPLDAVLGILGTRGWSWRDRFSLLKVCMGWQLRRFECAPQLSVADLCTQLPVAVMRTLIEPLCVSALNTPPERASGQVFLRVMRDALFAGSGASNLLLPRIDLSALMPDAALAWLQRKGGEVRLGARVQAITPAGQNWMLAGDAGQDLGGFDSLVLACPPLEAARLVQGCALPCEPWLTQTRGLRHEPIATVYAMAPGARLSQPMLALRSGTGLPAQFVFDRGQLGGTPGLLAFVVSISEGDSATLGSQVQAQAAQQLGLDGLQLIQTIVEKRATFACSPGLQRPGRHIAPGLLACGDYIDGPYPATLEGAVRSGLEAARALPAPAPKSLSIQ